MFWRIFVFSVFPLLFSACAQPVVFTEDFLNDGKQMNSQKDASFLEECLMFRGVGGEVFQSLSVLIFDTGPIYEKLPDTSDVYFRSGSCSGTLKKRGEEKEIFEKKGGLHKSKPYGFQMWKIPDWRYLWLVDSYYAQYVQDLRAKATAIRYRIDEYECACDLRCKSWGKLEIIFEREETVEYKQVWQQYLGKNLSDAQIKAVFRATGKREF